MSRMQFIFLITCLSITAHGSKVFGSEDLKVGREVYSVGERPTDPVCADFNGDGLMDIAVALKKQAVAVLLNNGKGGYDLASYDSMPHNTSIAAADVDGDGNIDLVPLTENIFGPVFLNTGKGKFNRTDVTYPALNNMSWHVKTADLNNDSLPDFVAASVTEDGIVIFMNEGKLKLKRVAVPLSELGKILFETKQRGRSSVLPPAKVERKTDEGIRDSENAARPRSEDELKEQRRLLSEKKASLDPLPISAGGLPEEKQTIQGREATDKDGAKAEGRLELTFPFRDKRAVTRIGGLKEFLIADLNGDGYNDLVLPSYALMRIYIGMNDGKGNFSFTVKDLTKDFLKEERFSLSSIAALRNGDKKVRFVAVAQENPGKILIFRNEDGSLVYDNSIDMPLSPAIRIVAADFNGDGFEDLAVTFGAQIPADNKSAVKIYLQDGKGKFSLAYETASDGYAAYINACCLGSGKEDCSLLMSNIHENSLTILKLPHVLPPVKTMGEQNSPGTLLKDQIKNDGTSKIRP